jgi:hypothetical protein
MAGRTVENPRNHVLSLRVSDAMKDMVTSARGGQSLQDFLHRALVEKLINERQALIDDIVRNIDKKPDCDACLNPFRME